MTRHISIVCLIGLLAATAAADPPGPLPKTIDFRLSTAPAITVYAQNQRTIRFTVEDNGDVVDISSTTQRVIWCESSASAGIVTASLTSVYTGTNGIFDATFSASDLNNDPGEFIYEVMVTDTGGAPVTVQQGDFTIKASPIATDAADLSTKTNINWDIYTFTGTPPWSGQGFLTNQTWNAGTSFTATNLGSEYYLSYPTNVSFFSNDVPYLSSMTETDPVHVAWLTAGWATHTGNVSAHHVKFTTADEIDPGYNDDLTNGMTFAGGNINMAGGSITNIATNSLVFAGGMNVYDELRGWSVSSNTYLKHDGSVAATGALNMDSNHINNVDDMTFLYPSAANTMSFSNGAFYLNQPGTYVGLLYDIYNGNMYNASTQIVVSALSSTLKYGGLTALDWGANKYLRDDSQSISLEFHNRLGRDTGSPGPVIFSWTNSAFGFHTNTQPTVSGAFNSGTASLLWKGIYGTTLYAGTSTVTSGKINGWDGLSSGVSDLATTQAAMHAVVYAVGSNDWFVCVSGSDTNDGRSLQHPKKTIAAATAGLGAAKAGGKPSGLVNVCSGTYAEDLILSNGVSLRGAIDRSTVINGSITLDAGCQGTTIQDLSVMAVANVGTQFTTPSGLSTSWETRLRNVSFLETSLTNFTASPVTIGGGNVVMESCNLIAVNADFTGMGTASGAWIHLTNACDFAAFGLYMIVDGMNNTNVSMDMIRRDSSGTTRIGSSIADIAITNPLYTGEVRWYYGNGASTEDLIARTHVHITGASDAGGEGEAIVGANGAQIRASGNDIVVTNFANSYSYEAYDTGTVIVVNGADDVTASGTKETDGGQIIFTGSPQDGVFRMELLQWGREGQLWSEMPLPSVITGQNGTNMIDFGKSGNATVVDGTTYVNAINPADDTVVSLVDTDNKSSPLTLTMDGWSSTRKHGVDAAGSLFVETTVSDQFRTDADGSTATVIVAGMTAGKPYIFDVLGSAEDAGVGATQLVFSVGGVTSTVGIVSNTNTLATLTNTPAATTAVLSFTAGYAGGRAFLNGMRIRGPSDDGMLARNGTTEPTADMDWGNYGLTNVSYIDVTNTVHVHGFLRTWGESNIFGGNLYVDGDVETHGDYTLSGSLTSGYTVACGDLITTNSAILYGTNGTGVASQVWTKGAGTAGYWSTVSASASLTPWTSVVDAAGYNITNVGSGHVTNNWIVEGEVHVAQYIEHIGDDNTKIDFSADDLSLLAGGNRGLKCEAGEVTINPGNKDMDFNVDWDDADDAFFIDGNTAAASFSHTLAVGTHTADGQFIVYGTNDGGNIIATIENEGNAAAFLDIESGGNTWAFGSGGSANGADFDNNLYVYFRGPAPAANDWAMFHTNGVGYMSLGTTVANPTNMLTVSGNIECTALYQTSDDRAKTNEVAIENATAKMMAIEPVSFEWDRELHPDYTKGTQYGVLAQQVAEHFPEAVRGGADGSLTVNYTAIQAMMLKTIQEQQVMIDDLEKRLKKLE